jgi:hypothetical protein
MGDENSVSDRWFTEGETSRRLGISLRAVRKLGDSGRIRVGFVPGLERGKRYSGEDVVRVAAERRNPEALEPEVDGPINLNGRVPDWTNETFINRLDSCWTFLMSHGYLDRAWSDQLRSRIEADISRAGDGGRFKTISARSEFEG